MTISRPTPLAVPVDRAQALETTKEEGSPSPKTLSTVTDRFSNVPEAENSIRDGTINTASSSKLRVVGRRTMEVVQNVAQAVAGSPAPSSSSKPPAGGGTHQFKGIFQQVESSSVENLGAQPSVDRTSTTAGPGPVRPGDFRQRLEILLASEENARGMAAKLYPRFEGELDRLNSVLQLLEERWGFPERVFPNLRTHLRRVSRQVDTSVWVSPEQWEEAFVAWLQGLHARCTETKVSRQYLIKQQRRTVADMERTYLWGAQLGRGSFGEVRLMLHKTLGVARVVKIVPKVQLDMDDEHVQHEVDLLRSLDHPHIIRIFETFESHDKLHIVMDYAEGGDLSRVIKQNNDNNVTLPEEWVLDACSQMVSSLQYMHSKGVIHCDLKPANIMLSKQFEIQSKPHILLADFGVSELFERRGDGAPMKMKGTPLYLAPEAFEGRLSCKSDMWAVGIIMYELQVGERPFKTEKTEGNNVFMLWKQIVMSEPALDMLPPVMADAVHLLLNKDAKARPSASEFHDHPWFLAQKTGLRTIGEASEEAQRPEGTALGHRSYFHRSAMFAIAAGMSMKDMRRFLSMFETLDLDKSGTLTLEELQQGLDGVGIAQDAKVVMNLLDLDQNGHISYTEFLAGAMQTVEDVTERLVQYAFETFDVDNDGVISMHELRSMLSERGPLADVLPDGTTVAEVMDEVSNGEGRISLPAFRAFMTKASADVLGSNGDHFMHASATSPRLTKDVMIDELENVIGQPDQKDSKRSHQTTPLFPSFHAWLEHLFAETEVGASFGRLLLFADPELEASYVSSTFTVTCQQTALLTFFFFPYCIWSLVDDDKRDLEDSILDWDRDALIAYKLAWIFLGVSSVVIFFGCVTWVALANGSARWRNGSLDRSAQRGEWILCAWGCLIPWVSCWFANRFRVSSVFNEDTSGPNALFQDLYSDYDLLLTFVGMMTFFTTRTHVRFVTMLAVATSCFLSYTVSTAAFGIADTALGTDDSDDRRWWPVFLLGLLSALILSGERALEHHRRVTYFSLYASYCSLKQLQEDDPSIAALLSEEMGSSKKQLTKSAKFSHALSLIRRLSEASEVTSRPLRVALKSLMNILQSVRTDILQADRWLAVDVRDVMQDKSLQRHAMEALLPMFEKSALDQARETMAIKQKRRPSMTSGSSKPSPVRKGLSDTVYSEAWGWDTLGGSAKPLASAGELFLAAAQNVDGSTGMQAVHALEALMQLYTSCPLWAEARSALAVRSSHWLCRRIGLWSELTPLERVGMLLAASSLHCDGGGFILFNTDNMMSRVACANKVMEVIGWSGLASGKNGRELCRLVCRATVRSQPQHMLEDARMLRLLLDCDDRLPAPGTDDRAMLIGLIVAAADFAFLALPLHLHQPWVDLCQAEASMVEVSQDAETLDVSSWLWGLVEILLDPIYETLEMTAGFISPSNQIEEPRQCVRDISKHWRGNPLMAVMSKGSLVRQVHDKKNLSHSDHSSLPSQQSPGAPGKPWLPGQVDQVD